MSIKSTFAETYQFSISHGTVLKRDHYFDPPVPFTYPYSVEVNTQLAGVSRVSWNTPKETLEKFFVTQWIPRSHKILVRWYTERFFKPYKKFRGKGKKRHLVVVYKVKFRRINIYQTIYYWFKSVTKQKRFGASGEGKGAYLKPNKLHYRSYVNTKLPIATAHLLFDSSLSGVNNEYINNVRSEYLSTFDPNITGGGGGHMYSTSPPLSYGMSLTLDNPVNEDLRSQALEKLYKKAISSVPDYITSFAETDELVRTLKLIFRQGTSLLIDLLSLNVKRLAGRLLSIKLKDISDIWLTWVYGIKPVVQDITDTLALVSTHERIWRSYSSSATLETEVLDSGSSSSSNYSGKTKIRQYHRYGVIVEGKLGFEEFWRRSQHWQTPIATGYELLPFSFMLDWLVDIGSYLKGMHFFEGLKYAAWETHGYVRNTIVDVTGAINDFRFSATGKSSKIQSMVMVNREVLDELPEYPSLSIPSSGQLVDAISIDRVLNSLAILVSRTSNH